MSARTLYIATSNPGKLRDFAAAAKAASASDQEFSIQPMPCLECIPPPPEEEATFEGNARAKAIYYSRFAPDLNTVADDSGLEVDALGGKPGVRSARFAADHGFASTGDGDSDNNLLLLQNMTGLSEAFRSCRYRCVLALARNGECALTAEGRVEGRLATNPTGGGGFGYDPLFYLPELGKTMAELDIETRLSLSHRGLALQVLFERLTRISASLAAPPPLSR